MGVEIGPRFCWWNPVIKMARSELMLSRASNDCRRNLRVRSVRDMGIYYHKEKRKESRNQATRQPGIRLWHSFRGTKKKRIGG
jgi:hypothetical protein